MRRYAAAFVLVSRDSLWVLPCPGDTERGSRCHPLSAWADCRPYLARVRNPRAHKARVAVGWVQAYLGESLVSGDPSPASRGERVCSEKSEHSKIPRQRSGANGRVRWLPTARAAVNPQQMGCRWGCERRAPLPVSSVGRVRGASFSEARGADKYSHFSGKKSSSSNSQNFDYFKIKKEK